MVRIGVFDSRAVACAWIRSKESMSELGKMRAEYDAAKAAGDDERVLELDKLGPAMQEQFHLQVFGNEPIDDVLARIEKELPKVAAGAGVDVLVSKWEIAYQGKNAEFVDVTWEMANLFEPDAATLKVIEELLEVEPMPAEELRGHHED